MRETRQSGSEGGARFKPSSLPLSGNRPGAFARVEFHTGELLGVFLDPTTTFLFQVLDELEFFGMDPGWIVHETG